MSTPLLPRQPAFAGLRPGLPEFSPANADEYPELTDCLGPGQLLARTGSVAAPAGYFLHRGRGGTSFVKVVPSAHAARQSAADRVALWVGSKGVKTPVRLSGFPRDIGGHSVFAYAHVAGRFADSTPADLAALGANLALLHAALARVPDAAAIRKNSADRTAMLLKRRDAVRAGTNAAGPQPALLRELLERECDLFAMLDEGPACQALHGDLVYANVLFPEDGGAPYLLDFEDSLISWLPVDLDIALALERFALVPDQPDEQALALGRAMLRAYGEARSKDGGLLARPLGDCLRLLSVRALTTLAELEAAGTPFATAEWDKFFALYRHAVRRAPLLERMQDGFLA